MYSTLHSAGHQADMFFGTYCYNKIKPFVRADILRAGYCHFSQHFESKIFTSS